MSLTCPEGCFDLRLLPFGNGSPYGLSPGRKGDIWMTIDDREDLFRIVSGSACKSHGPMISGGCFHRIAFHAIETLYHAKYHQEITIPTDPKARAGEPEE